MTRELKDLRSIGPKTVQALARMGVTSVPQLAKADARELYERHSAIDGKLEDPCVLDTFSCAIAQARDPDLPAEQKDWWWWSRQRKAGG